MTTATPPPTTITIVGDRTRLREFRVDDLDDSLAIVSEGYAIAYYSWGKGYATDAARIAIDCSFTELGLHRISAATGPDNAPSIAVVTKLGFVHEGRRRDHVFTNGS
ncbi:MAG: GNAT family N-acetyltransferase [Pseudonocardia sp.]|nr:GNAT family N-acetyltransferase [Pseudonocardia sp.]